MAKYEVIKNGEVNYIIADDSLYDELVKEYDEVLEIYEDEYQEEVEIPVSPMLNTSEFKLLLTLSERVKLKELRINDLIIDDFFDILEDTRINEINLTSASIVESITYCVDELIKAGTINSDNRETRINEILSKTFK